MNFASKWKETEKILLSEVTQKGNMLCSLLWEAPHYKSSDEITHHGVIAETSRVKWTISHIDGWVAIEREYRGMWSGWESGQSKRDLIREHREIETVR